MSTPSVYLFWKHSWGEEGHSPWTHHYILYFLTVWYQFVSRHLVHIINWLLIHQECQSPVRYFPIWSKRKSWKTSLNVQPMMKYSLHKGFPRAAGQVTLSKRKGDNQPWLILNELILSQPSLHLEPETVRLVTHSWVLPEIEVTDNGLQIFSFCLLSCSGKLRYPTVSSLLITRLLSVMSPKSLTIGDPILSFPRGPKMLFLKAGDLNSPGAVLGFFPFYHSILGFHLPLLRFILFSIPLHLTPSMWRRNVSAMKVRNKRRWKSSIFFVSPTGSGPKLKILSFTWC